MTWDQLFKAAVGEEVPVAIDNCEVERNINRAATRIAAERGMIERDVLGSLHYQLADDHLYGLSSETGARRIALQFCAIGLLDEKEATGFSIATYKLTPKGRKAALAAIEIRRAGG